ncbi:MAG: hypothetical protein L6264_04960 [Weeksellaceae bacterium]|nr:hypothetical protein [Bacteroidota bacterium]MCG2780279.1 hypothetical protein [Weeksellaceae bacterium]
MEKKLFTVVSTISMIFLILAAVFSAMGTVFTGFYPGVPVLAILALIPVLSRLYSKKIDAGSDSFRRNYYLIFTAVNLLVIMVGLWMVFVILIDRVFSRIL